MNARYEKLEAAKKDSPEKIEQIFRNELDNAIGAHNRFHVAKWGMENGMTYRAGSFESIMQDAKSRMGKPYCAQ